MVKKKKKNKALLRLIKNIFIAIVLWIIFVFFFVLGFKNSFLPMSNLVDKTIFLCKGYVNNVKLKAIYATKKSDKNNEVQEVIFTLAGNIDDNLLDSFLKEGLSKDTFLKDYVYKDDLTFINVRKTIDSSSYEKISKENLKVLSIDAINLNKATSNNASEVPNIFNIHKDLILEVNNKTIAFTTYNANKNDIHFLSDMRKNIYNLKKKSNFVVLVLDNEDYDENKSNDLAHFAIDSGIDIVINNNSNSSSTEVYKNRFIINKLGKYYSLEEDQSIYPLYQVSIVFSKDRLVALGMKAIPYNLKYSSNYNAYLPQGLNKEDTEKYLENINSLCKNFDLSTKFNFIQLK